MISARQALCSFARQFFETEIPGIYSWRDVEVGNPEPSDPEPTGRKNRLGKFKERVVLSFDEFRMELESTECKPPLGRVQLFVNDTLSAEGSLDASTMVKVGDVIKECCDAS